MRKLQIPSIALVLGLTLGLLSSGYVPLTHAQQKADRIVVPQDLASYRDVVKKVLPAVVYIESSGKASTRQAKRSGDDQLSPDDLPPEFRRFFEDMQKRRGDSDKSDRSDRMPRTFASGSGFIIDPKGIIVTNNHVVAGADSVEVTLKDGRKFTSKEITADPKTDVAVIKVKSSSPLPFVEIGDSDAMEIGDRVLAVGAPFGLQGSVTSGIVSGKGRVLGMSNDSIEDFIQTDAAINPGNSGGPLINLAGQVVGMSTAIKSQSGGFQGVGMCVPSNMLKDVAFQLAKDGTVKRGYLGISMQDLSPDLAQKLQVPNAHGVVVVQTLPNTPAAKAGLKEGDIVTTFNGKEIDDMRVLQRKVLSLPVGQAADLGVLRNGKPEHLKITMEQRPDDYGMVSMDRRRPKGNNSGKTDSVTIEKFGMDVSDATQALAEQLGYKDAKGVIVTNVDQDGLAASAGLARGIMIVEAERKPVESAQALKDILEKANLDEGVLLLVRVPRGPAQYVIIKSSDK